MTDLVSDILAALASDPGAPTGLDWNQFYAQLPDILSDHLDEPVTLQGVIACSYKWTLFLLEVDAPKTLYGFINSPEMEHFRSIFGDPVARMRRRLEDSKKIQAVFAQGKARAVPKRSERHSLIEHGLKGAALYEYDKGTLTIKDLLRLSPLVIAPLY